METRARSGDVRMVVSGTLQSASWRGRGKRCKNRKTMTEGTWRVNALALAHQEAARPEGHAGERLRQEDSGSSANRRWRSSADVTASALMSRMRPARQCGH
jgi:hypothetical protein